MIVREFSPGSTKEHTVKLINELLQLFGIKIISDGKNISHRGFDTDNTLSAADEPIFAYMGVQNELRKQNGIVAVDTTLTVIDAANSKRQYRQSGTAHSDESERAAYHRLLKLNLYDIFRREFDMPSAPWGILHGVRPTKIARRFIEAKLTREQITERFKTDYAVSKEKTDLLTDIAFLQQPFLQNSDERLISVYIGIPFCLTRCLYCSFPSNVLPDGKKLTEYMEVFYRDLTAAAENMREHGLKAENIYIGGGTPTSLPEDFFAAMLKKVMSAFATPNLLEFTLEAGRPDSITPNKIALMKEFGVNRVSVNPQTMNEATLRRIGRQHTPEQIVAMFGALRQAGNFHINMDVILGLPGETAADTADTMQKIAALDPDSVTLHALTLKRGSNLKFLLDEHPDDVPSLPTDDETRRMYETAMRYTEKMGMRPYYLYRQGYMKGDLDNVGCCHADKMSRYNIKIMAESQTIIGIGAGAASKIVDVREKRIKSSFNPKDLLVYMREIENYINKRADILAEVYDVQ